MNYIYTIERLKKKKKKVIPTLPQTIPYKNDREDILKRLYLDYKIQLYFNIVYSIVTSYCIKF